MRIPIQKLINSLYNANYNHYNNAGTKRLFWSILLQARGEVNVDINELIESYYDEATSEIVDLVQEYGSSNEIGEFLKHTKGLITDKTYLILEGVMKAKAKREVDVAIKKAKADKTL